MAKTTQKERVLQYIRDFGGISSFEAFRELGVTRLSAVVFDLKRAGYNIKSTVTTGSNRYGDKVYFSTYTLEAEDGTTITSD